MAAEPERHLHLVDRDTGEIHGECPRCQELEVQLEGEKVDKSSWRAKFYTLKRDKEKDAKQNPLWPTAVRLFALWKEVAGHPNSEFTWDRFEMVEPHLKRKPPKGGEELCVRAIVGQVFDPFITTRKNGTKKHHDGWHLCFGTRDKFEEACCKAPADWREQAQEAGYEFEAERLAGSAKGSAPTAGRAGRGAQHNGTTTRRGKSTG